MGDWSSQLIITAQNNQELYAIVHCLQLKIRYNLKAIFKLKR